MHVKKKEKKGSALLSLAENNLLFCINTMFTPPTQLALRNVSQPQPEQRADPSDNLRSKDNYSTQGGCCTRRKEGRKLCIAKEPRHLRIRLGRCIFQRGCTKKNYISAHRGASAMI